MNLYTNNSEYDKYRGLPITPAVVLGPIVDLAKCFDMFVEGKVPCQTGTIFPVDYDSNNVDQQRKTGPQWY